MKAVVLDTTVASIIFRQLSEAQAILEGLVSTERILSFQTVAEMRFGAEVKGWGLGKRNILEEFISEHTIVHSSDELISCWSMIKMEASKVGRRLESSDAWIAATAKLLDVPLLTQDKDFDEIACPSVTVIRF